MVRMPPLELARRSWQQNRPGPALLFVLHRLGNDEQLLSGSEELFSRGGSDRNSALLFRAIAHYRLGRITEANLALAAGMRLVEQTYVRSSPGQLPLADLQADAMPSLKVAVVMALLAGDTDARLEQDCKAIRELIKTPEWSRDAWSAARHIALAPRPIDDEQLLNATFGQANGWWGKIGTIALSAGSGAESGAAVGNVPRYSCREAKRQSRRRIVVNPCRL